MIYLLDTNVVSETMKPQPSIAVAAWMRAQLPRSLFTAAICQAEILAGIAVMPDGRRRGDLAQMAETLFGKAFEGRILHFNEDAARAYAWIVAQRRAIGRPIDTADLMVAATARAHSAAVVTRDAGGFDECGLTLINPWDASVP